MEKILKDFTYKANRFIDSLAKRNDPKLNEFFIELSESIQKLADTSEEVASEFGTTEYEKSILREENKLLKLLLSMFCNIRFDELTKEEIIYLDEIKSDGYYSAKSFFDDLNMIREVRELMKMLHPDVDRMPKDRESLIDGYKYLNEKLCSLIQTN